MHFSGERTVKFCIQKQPEIQIPFTKFNYHSFYDDIAFPIQGRDGESYFILRSNLRNGPE